MISKNEKCDSLCKLAAVTAGVEAAFISVFPSANSWYASYKLPLSLLELTTSLALEIRKKKRELTEKDISLDKNFHLSKFKSFRVWPLRNSNEKIIGCLGIFGKKEIKLISKEKKMMEEILFLIRSELVINQDDLSKVTVINPFENKNEDLDISTSKFYKTREVSGMGYWFREAKSSGIMYWSDEVFNLWEADPKVQKPDLTYFLKTIHPDDREYFHQAYEKTLRGEQDLDVEHRLLYPSGKIRWVHELGKLRKDKDGITLGLECWVHEITAKKEEEQHLHLLEKVIANTSDIILITEANHLDKGDPKIVFVNDSFTRITGYEAEEVIGKTPRILQGPLTSRKELDRIKNSIEKGESCEVDLINYTKKGEEYWMHIRIDPVKNDRDEITHFIAIHKNVSQEKTRELEKKIIAETGRIFNEEAELTQCLDKVLDHLCSIGDFSLAEIWVPSVDKKKLILLSSCEKDVSARNFYRKAGKKPLSMQDESLVATVFHQRETEIWEDISNHQSFYRSEAASAAGLNSAIALPLTHNNVVKGVLLLAITREVKELIKFQKLFNELGYFLGSEIKRKRLETELAQMFQSAPDIITIIDTKGHFIKINPAACAILGFNEEELLSRSFLKLIHPDDKKQTMEEFKSLKKGKKTYSFENRYIHKSGDVVWLSWNGTINKEEGLIYAIAKDISEIKKLQKLLHTATQMSRLGGFEYTVKDQKLFWSPMTKLIHEVDESYTPNFREAIEFYHPDYQENVKETVNRAMEEGVPWDEEWCLITASGEEKWVHSIGQSEFVNGECIRLYGSLQDIDMLKRAQLELQETNIRYQLATEASSMGIWDFDVIQDRMRWDENMVRLYGAKEFTLEGNLQSWIERLHPEDQSRFKRELKVALSEKNTHSTDFRIIYPDGNIKYIRSFANLFRDDKGKAIRIVGVNMDITEEKLREQALKYSHERFEKVSEATNDAIWDWNISTEDLYWGAGFKVLFGYDPDDHKTVGAWAELLHEEDRERAVKSLEAAINNPDIQQWQEEYRFLTHYGTYAYVLDRGRIIRNDDGEAIRMVGAIMDFTQQRKYAESLKELNLRLESHARERDRYIEELKDSQKRYSELFHLSPQPMWVYDMESLKFIDVNEAATKLYGYSYEEFLNMTLKDIRPPSEVPEFLKAIKKLKKKNRHYSKDEYWHRRKNGENMLVEIRSNLVEIEGRQTELVLAVDITERMEHLRSIEAQNAKLQEIAWTQSHVVRAPLARIMGLINFITDDYEVSEEEKKMVLRNIILSADELDAIIRDIVDKSQPLKKQR